MKKKITAAVVVIAVLAIIGGLLFTAYRSSESYRQKKSQVIDTHTTIQIGATMYYNTAEAVPVEPDESIIVDGHPSENDAIEAYAIINPGDVDEMVVGRIDGEWYKFLPREN